MALETLLIHVFFLMGDEDAISQIAWLFFWWSWKAPLGFLVLVGQGCKGLVKE